MQRENGNKLVMTIREATTSRGIKQMVNKDALARSRLPLFITSRNMPRMLSIARRQCSVKNHRAYDDKNLQR